MKYDYWPLRQRIKEDFGSYYKFADALGIQNTRLSILLSGKAVWPQDLIYKAALLLGLRGEIEEYFFRG